MDRLTSMRLFARVVEHGSFTAAAEGVGLSPTMIANHVKDLEHHLGVQLLSRTTRISEVTQAGQQYYEHCLTITRQIQEAADSIRQINGSPSGVLRVTAPISFGAEELIPALNEYTRKYTDVRIDLELSDRIVDLVKEQYDVAIRVGPPTKSPDLKGTALCRWRRIVCGSSDYLDHRGHPITLEDLKKHHCLCYAYASGPEFEWRFQSIIGGIETITVNCMLSVNNGHALKKGALAGLGLIFQPASLVACELDDGRLVHVLQDYSSPDAALHIYTRMHHRSTPKVSTFVTYIVDHFV